jgi:hypothetical protein
VRMSIALALLLVHQPSTAQVDSFAALPSLLMPNPSDLRLELRFARFNELTGYTTALALLKGVSSEPGLVTAKVSS